jgi:hypothetical protein
MAVGAEATSERITLFMSGNSSIKDVARTIWTQIRSEVAEEAKA